MHAGGATRALPAPTPVPPRDIVIGGVRWQMSAEEYHTAGGSSRRRPGLGGPVVSITCLRFTTGRLTRITYVTHAAADVMAWPDRELTTLFDVTIPAPAA
jgi:hypothetical protein